MNWALLLTAYKTDHTFSFRPPTRGDPPVSDGRSDVLQGTLEMLVLRILSLEPMHGWGVSIRLRQISRDVFDVNQGSLYPALQRLVTRGWVRSSWRTTENNRRARV